MMTLFIPANVKAECPPGKFERILPLSFVGKKIKLCCIIPNGPCTPEGGEEIQLTPEELATLETPSK